jgi:hypothetical protein
LEANVKLKRQAKKGKRSLARHDPAWQERAARADALVQELHRHLARRGLKLTVSVVRSGETAFAHWVVRDGGRDVLHVWPASLKLWRPESGDRGRLADLWDLLKLVRPGPHPEVEDAEPWGGPGPEPLPTAPPRSVCGIALNAVESGLLAEAVATGELVVGPDLPVHSPVERAWRLWCEQNGRPHRVRELHPSPATFEDSER